MKNMMSTVKLLGIGGLLIVLCTGLFMGCDVVNDREERSLTGPGMSAPQEFPGFNYFSSDETLETAFTWSCGVEVLCVNIPTAGDYLITYFAAMGTYTLVVRANEPALLHIGLQAGDSSVAAPLVQRGVISAGATALMSNHRTAIYAWPSHPEVTWQSVFTLQGVQDIVVTESSAECFGGEEEEEEVSATAAPAPPVSGTVRGLLPGEFLVFSDFGLGVQYGNAPGCTTNPNLTIGNYSIAGNQAYFDEADDPIFHTIPRLVISFYYTSADESITAGALTYSVTWGGTTYSCVNTAAMPPAGTNADTTPTISDVGLGWKDCPDDPGNPCVMALTDWDCTP